IEIDQANPADACRGKIEPKRRTETARADEQNAGGLESFLPLAGHLGHDEVPAVASDFLRRKCDTRGAIAEQVEGGKHDVNPRSIWCLVFSNLSHFHETLNTKH